MRVKLANEAWEALLGAHGRLVKTFASQEMWDRVSMREYDVLYTLAKSDKPTRLGDLHRGVLLSQPALSRMVDRLANRGLLERQVDPSDRRGVLLSLTKDGRTLQKQIGRRHARRVAESMSSSLTDEELSTLKGLCSKLG